MTRLDHIAERMAKLRRDLDELKSRLIRIEGETFLGKRNVEQISAELQRLESLEQP